MTTEQWDRLMDQARLSARCWGVRVEVRAGLRSPRAARRAGSRWDYVVMTPGAVGLGGTDAR